MSEMAAFNVIMDESLKRSVALAAVGLRPIADTGLYAVRLASRAAAKTVKAGRKFARVQESGRATRAARRGQAYTRMPAPTVRMPAGLIRHRQYSLGGQ